MRRFAFTKIVGLLLLPLAIASLQLAFRFPEATESLYAQGLYQRVVWAFGVLNRTGVSVAEWLLASTLFLAAWVCYRLWKRSARGRRFGHALVSLWSIGGVMVWIFLVLWGFNYARPSLEQRMGLSRDGVDARAVLAAGSRTAELTTALYRELGSEHAPTRLPISLEELDLQIDRAFRDLKLPGDTIDFRTTPAKPLRSSTLFSYLGVSGIFVPFTGEPSINALQPDAALPMVLAHEKAHQRGITHEGEASFAAFLACSSESTPAYLRYAAYLFATRQLLSAASHYLSRDEMAPAWNLLGEGPRQDLRAIQRFWERYDGTATDVAHRVNDRYLRALNVPEGAQSYGTVVRMLMALEEQGFLVQTD